MSAIYPSPTAGLRVIIKDYYLSFFPQYLKKRADIFFDGVWPKWFFNALRCGKIIDEIAFRPRRYRDIIDPTNTDMPYLSKKLGIGYNIVIPDADVPSIMRVAVKLNELTPLQLERARTLYTGPRENFMNDVHRLQSYYAGLEGDGKKTTSNSNFLSIPPGLGWATIKSKKYKTHELFGSPFNTFADTYSSAFALERELFSSCGSFDKYVPFDRAAREGEDEKKLLIVNPPFDEVIIGEAADMVIRLVNDDARLLVIFVIPDWPEEGFPARQRLRWASQSYGTSRSAAESKFFNYGTDEYVPVSAAAVFVLSKKQCDITAADILKKWREI